MKTPKKSWSVARYMMYSWLLLLVVCVVIRRVAEDSVVLLETRQLKTGLYWKSMLTMPRPTRGTLVKLRLKLKE